MAKKKLTLEDMLMPKDEIPYDVPENWTSVKLTSIFKFEKGKKPKILLDNEDEQTIPYVTINYFQTKQASQYTYETETNRICKDDDILIVWDGARAGLVGMGVSGALGSTLCKIKFNGLNPKFVYYYFIGKYDEINKNTKGTGIPHVDPSYLDTLVFNIPPLAEQERIVKRIESLFDKVDRATELVDEARDGFEKRRAAILEMAFSGQLTKKWREENRNEVINIKSNNTYKGYNIPDNWIWVTIEDIMTVKGGKRLPKGEKLLSENTGYPYIRAGDLKQGTVITDNIQYISKEVYEKIKNYYVNEGDVYITIVGACIGDVGIVPKELDGANLTENAAKLCNKGNINSKFISRYLSSNFAQTMLKSDIASATLGKLSLTKIKNFIVPIPPIEEQNEIVTILDKLLDNEDTVKENINIVENIDVIKKSILAKAFRGELGSNDLNEESSIELLKELIK